MPTLEDTKLCRDCRQLLPLGRFSRNGRKDGYHRPECRRCQHQRSAATNPNYQKTAGSVNARASHDLSLAELKHARAVKMAEQGFECVYCSARLHQSCHVDHIMPRKLGGSNDLGNLQALCSRCNQEKHAKSSADYIAWLKQTRAIHAPDRQKLLNFNGLKFGGPGGT